jgi:hypothetical protein
VLRDRADRRCGWRRLDDVIDQVLADIRRDEPTAGGAA